MSDEQPVFSIEKIYVKDLSLEVPNAPQDISSSAKRRASKCRYRARRRTIGDGMYEVALTVTVSAKNGETAFFLVEVVKAGIFQIRNVPEQDLEPILAVACPNILFPYARETVSDAINRGGFPPVILAPVNFEALYQQRLMEQQQGESKIQLQ
jgi:preprotein translocase subunit SecB